MALIAEAFQSTLLAYSLDMYFASAFLETHRFAQSKTPQSMQPDSQVAAAKLAPKAWSATHSRALPKAVRPQTGQRSKVCGHLLFSHN